MQPASASRKERYTMSELRREFGVTARTLRFYEDRGLLHPCREGQTRIFSYRDRARLELILRGKRVGFSLADMKEMLDLYNLKDGQVTQLRFTLRKMRERIEALEQQRRDIDAGIVDLKRTARLIESMLSQREKEASARDDLTGR